MGDDSELYELVHVIMRKMVEESAKEIVSGKVNKKCRGCPRMINGVCTGMRKNKNEAYIIKKNGEPDGWVMVRFFCICFKRLK